MIYTHTKTQLPVREMRLELICAFLAIAMVTIGTSAVISGRQNDADDEWSVRDALFSGGGGGGGGGGGDSGGRLDEDDGHNVLGDDE